MGDDVVTVYDERGREMYISREEWETKVLPANIEESWDDADTLYSLIVTALDDGFEHAVLEAAERLAEIDHVPERGAVMRGATELKTGQLQDAETTLAAFAATHGETGIVLTNLSKVYHAQGRRELAEQTLARAIRLDPNQEHGLQVWTALQEERGGEAAWLTALEEAAALEDAWLPQLFIARRYLAQKRVHEAVDLFKEVAGKAPPQSDAAVAISGELGEAGLVAEMLEILLPGYDAENHHPYAGMNLARACLMTGRVDEGRALLRTLQARNLPPLAESLAELERELAQAAPKKPLAETPEIQVIVIATSLWSGGLEEPDWLFPLKSPKSTRILLSSFADVTRGAEGTGRLEASTDRGRLTRSLPLFLTEAVHLRTNARAACAIPAVPGQGVVVFGAPWSPSQLTGYEFDGAPPDLVITGWLTDETVEIDLYDAKRESSRGRVVIDGFEPVDIEIALFKALAQADFAFPLPQVRDFDAPRPEFEEAYLLGLGQLLDQLLVAHDLFPKEVLWNERAMYETCFDLAEQTGMAPTKLMALCSFLSGVRYGSPLVASYERSLLKMLEEERGSHSPLDRLAPLAHLRLGDEEMYELECRRLEVNASDAYRRWLAALAIADR